MCLNFSTESYCFERDTHYTLHCLQYIFFLLFFCLVCWTHIDYWHTGNLDGWHSFLPLVSISILTHNILKPSQIITIYINLAARVSIYRISSIAAKLLKEKLSRVQWNPTRLDSINIRSFSSLSACLFFCFTSLK